MRWTKPSCAHQLRKSGLSLNRYREAEHVDEEHRPPLEIIADIEALEAEISEGLAELKAMLA
ncbi:MAG: hypothetical protein ACYCV4_19035 [Dermatophilaceae bacterium]